MDHRFGRAEPFALGVEEELLRVDAGTGELAHVSSRLVPALEPQAGTLMHDAYEAPVESASPSARNAIEELPREVIAGGVARVVERLVAESAEPVEVT